MEASNSSMDDLDRQWLESVTPEGFVALGFLSVIAYMDTEGDIRIKNYNQLDSPLSQCIDLLELAKLDLIGRCPGMWEQLHGDES